MRFAFRVDSSSRIGSGHVVRCVTLAKCLTETGNQVSFLCKNLMGNAYRVVTAAGSRLEYLTEDANVSPIVNSTVNFTSGNTAYTVADWEQDARATIDVLARLTDESGERIDCVIVDHYGLDYRWEERVASSCGRILAIDDLAKRKHKSALLLDQNWVPNFASRYRSLVPDGCRVMLGPRYAMLQNAYSVDVNSVPRRPGPKRLLVYFGGGDDHGLTAMVIRAFVELSEADVRLTAILGNAVSGIAEIQAMAGQNPSVELIRVQESLFELLASTDCVFGAGGATSWERIRMGVPAMVITMAENQEAIAAHLDQIGLIRWLGKVQDITPMAIKESLRNWMANGFEERPFGKAKQLIDGKGAQRVAAVLTVTSNEAIFVRRVLQEDESLLLEWTNDPLTRASGFNPNQISENDHHRWFQNKLIQGPDRLFLLATTSSGVEVGQVRFERNSEQNAEQNAENNVEQNKDGNHSRHWEVHYSVAPIFRGLGLGRAVLQSALETFQSENPFSRVLGRVRFENIASQKIFKKLGFERDFCEGNDFMIFSMDLP